MCDTFMHICGLNWPNKSPWITNRCYEACPEQVFSNRTEDLCCAITELRHEFYIHVLLVLLVPNGNIMPNSIQWEDISCEISEV